MKKKKAILSNAYPNLSAFPSFLTILPLFFKSLSNRKSLVILMSLYNLLTLVILIKSLRLPASEPSTDSTYWRLELLFN